MWFPRENYISCITCYLEMLCKVTLVTNGIFSRRLPTVSLINVDIRGTNMKFILTIKIWQCHYQHFAIIEVYLNSGNTFFSIHEQLRYSKILSIEGTYPTRFCYIVWSIIIDISLPDTMPKNLLSGDGYGDAVVVSPYLCSGIFYTGRITFLYRNAALVIMLGCTT